MNASDYIKWRGDLSFETDPFNEIDGLIFAYISYLDIAEFVEKDGTRLSKVAKEFTAKYKESVMASYATHVKFAVECFELAGKSKRFGNCLIHDCVNEFHKDTTEQFFACMFDVPYSPGVVAFRGTDASMIGWKEDLILSYGDIPSQFDAVLYLQNHCKWHRKYRVVGHSKGGNLAQYSVMNATKDIQRRIVQFINYDGPGIPYDVYDGIDEKIKDKFLKVIPDSDVVGTIYHNDSNTIIAKASEEYIKAHNAQFWEVMGNSFVTCKEVLDETVMIKDAFDSFIVETTAEQKAVFVSKVFDKLFENGIETVGDMINFGPSKTIKLIKSMMELDDEVKEVGSLFIKKFSDVFTDEFNERIDDKRKRIRNRVKLVGGQTIDSIFGKGKN